MLVLDVKMSESYDEERNLFIAETFRLELEHSLLSLSKWESRFEKIFLDGKTKTEEQVVGYVEAMTLTPNTPPEVYLNLSQSDVELISNYISSRQSGAYFTDPPTTPGRKEVVTSEVIYGWLFSLSLPKECETWHLNRLFNVIRLQSAKNGGNKKTSRSQMIAQRRALNEKRRAQMGTTG